MANTPDELKKKIEDLLKSTSKLTGAQVKNFNDALKGAGNELDRLNELYDDIIDKVDRISNSLNYVYESLLDSVDELSNQNKYLNIQKSALNKIADIAKNIVNIRRGETDLDAKKLVKLQQETTERIRQLQLVRNKGNLSDEEIKAIEKQIKSSTELYAGFDKVLEVNKAINKQLGAAPALAAGIDKALSKLGLPDLGFNEAILETRRLGQEADTVNKNFNAWKTYTGIIWNNFKGIFTSANLIQGSIALIIDTFKSVDSAIGDMAKGLDMSYNSAANLRMELTDIANFSGDAAVNTKGLQESLMAVSQTLGVNARLSSEDLVTFTKLREQAGYTNEELTSMQRITTITGGSLEANSKTFLGTIGKLNAQNKLAINAKQLFKDIANVSDAIKLSVGGTAEKIATAAFKAKQFGINLQQADGIASSLLDFESSISNELSAELITGKDLNLEKARLLAINGDIAGASAEILKQVGGTAEFTKMNRIQQEALAKSVGMTREDLAKSLVDREASAKLGAKEGQSAQDRYNELVKSYGVEKASAMLGDEALARQFQQQSTQERFSQSIEKLKEVFVSLVEPLMPVLDVFASIFKIVGPIAGLIGTMVKYTIQWGKYLLPLIGAYKGFQVASLILDARKTAQLALQGNAMAIQNIMLEKSIVKKGVYHALALQEAYTEKGIAGIKAYGLALDEKSLARKIILFGWNLKDSIVSKSKALWEMISGKAIMSQIAKIPALIGLKTTEAAVATETAAAATVAAEAVSFGAATAWILGGLGAVLGAMALYSMKDGEIDYGKGPVVSGDFGSVQLSPKDTGYFNGEKIVAGTNLGGGNKPQPQQQAPPPPAAPIIVQVSPNVNVGKERISNAFQQNSYSIS